MKTWKYSDFLSGLNNRDEMLKLANQSRNQWCQAYINSVPGTHLIGEDVTFVHEGGFTRMVVTDRVFEEACEHSIKVRYYGTIIEKGERVADGHYIIAEHPIP